MDSLRASRICGGNTAYKRVASDFYPTPPEVTQALMEFLNLPGGVRVWEPACGEGHMSTVMRKNGLTVVETDISTGTDFLTADLPEGVHWIITNPPFSLSDKFIQKCVEHDRPFALLLKAQYWHAKKRFDLFRNTPPRYILPLTWRPDFLFKERGAGSPLMDVMWCVWDGRAARTTYIPLWKPELLEGGTDND